VTKDPHCTEASNARITLGFVPSSNLRTGLFHVHPVDAGVIGHNKMRQLLREAGLPGQVEEVQLRCR
jgi:hypothetical protein